MKVQVATPDPTGTNGQVAPGAVGDIAILWRDAQLCCVLSWTGDRYRVRLVRGSRLIRDDFENDERIAMAVGCSWQASASLGTLDAD